MKPKTFMLIAGEASGDLLAAELVAALRAQSPDARFFGAGGAKMSAAGVDLAFDLTRHAVVGITDVLKNLLKFRRMLHQLLALAVERKPDAIIGVDYGGFNLRFGHAVKEYVRNNPFSQWNPKIVQFVSPQVWASRPGRAQTLAADYDLLLSIFPFEKDWYARHAPKLRVEFVGHPMVGRFANEGLQLAQQKETKPAIGHRPSKILLLPGSRQAELQHHLPVMLAALKLVREKMPEARAKMVLPNPGLVQLAKAAGADLEIQIGELPWALSEADVALSKTGTVTMECACFGVPTVTLYKKPLLGLALALRIITVKSLTMPNLLAGGEVFPEFLQKNATPENLANALLALLQDGPRRQQIKSRLTQVMSSLGEPGAPARAAAAVLVLCG